MRKGRKLSDATKKKIGDAHRNKVVSPETRAKISAGLLASGYKHSDETRRKMSKSKSGSKSHLWKGGITKKNEAARRTVEYKIWRDAVFIRDDYTCQDCKTKGCTLEAHHIKSFADHIELRYEVTNGLTLCVKCHEKTDNYKRKIMHEKNGMLTEKSLSDFRDEEGKVKKASFYDADGYAVADKDNRDKLTNPKKIKE